MRRKCALLGDAIMKYESGYSFLAQAGEVGLEGVTQYIESEDGS